jgi:mono/diheme cytochrome c family protein
MKKGKYWINLVLFVALLGAVALCYFTPPRDMRLPNYEFIPEAQMVQSPAYDSFARNPNFADRLTLRTPPPGVLARGSTPLHYLPTLEDALRAGEELKTPFPPLAIPVLGASTAGLLASPSSQGPFLAAYALFPGRTPPLDTAQRERGATVFTNFCQVCHGPLGLGNGPVALGGFPPPASLQAERAVQMKAGQMFHVLTYGQGNMPSLAAQLSEDDRWSVILHVRTALQAPSTPEPRMQAVAQLFNDNCSACHGRDGAGEPAMRKIRPLIPNFTSLAWQMSQTEVAIVNQINYGTAPMMPAFRYKLKPQEVIDLAVYVRYFAAHQPGAPPTPTPASQLTPTSIYFTYCSNCHDLNGKGNAGIRIGNADLPNFASTAWQKSRTDADLAKSIFEGMGPGKLMQSRKAELGSVDVKDMVALVRHFEGGKWVPEPPPPALGGPILSLDLPARDAASLGGLLGSPSGYGPLLAASGLAAGLEPIPPPGGVPDIDAPRIRVGQTIFRGVCITCHGPDGTGSQYRRLGMPLIPDFTSEAFQADKQRNDVRLRVSILDGRGPIMQANRGRVTEEQARDLVAYIRTFGPGGPPVNPGSPDAEFSAAVRRLEKQLDDLHKQLQDVKGKP